MNKTPQMTREQRNKTCKIDLYSIMVACKYFETIDDFINLEFSSKRFENNMERFRFNPITLTQNTFHFFPSLETLHLYNESDELFKENDQIWKRIHWYLIDYKTYLNKDKDESDVFKSVCYTKENRKEFGDIIPPQVNFIEERCYCDCKQLEELDCQIQLLKFLIIHLLIVFH